VAPRESRCGPNVLVFASDDQGPWALGAAGNPEILTPHLDRLAASGRRFTNFFCTSPVCSPARASLLTGRIPSQHGVHDWIRAGNVGDDAVQYLAGQTTYTQVLAAQGWHCGLVGKWHLGDSQVAQQGFSYWFVHESGGSPYHGAPMIRDGRRYREPAYVTDVLADDAMGYLDRRAAAPEPFYLGVHFTAPHSPWVGQHPRELLEAYDDCPFASCPQEAPHPWRKAGSKAIRDAYRDPRAALQGYFAAITGMDRAIGRVLARLDELGLTERTLVCFLSDNGFNAGHHGIWGKGNGTLPLNMYDDSVKVPFILSQPGSVRPGVSDALVSGYDLRPTLLDVLAVADEPEIPLPGRSFAPLLLGEEHGERSDLVVHDEYGPTRMIRTPDLKYVHRYPYGPHELYDLAEDPGEGRNLVDDPGWASARSDLRRRLAEWFDRYVDPALDGAREPVRGWGQAGRVGRDARGELSFFEESED